MTLLPPGVKVHLAYGYTDMRAGVAHAKLNGIEPYACGVRCRDL